MRPVPLQDFISQHRRERRGPDRPDDPSLDLLLARARGQARADGFAEGVAETEARIERELEARLDAVLEALDAARRDRREAYARAAEDAGRVVLAFLRGVAPAIGQAALGAELAAAVESALLAAPSARPRIETAHGGADALRAALGPYAEDCVFAEAPGLGLAEARIRWDDGFDQIDLEAAIRRGLEILEAHLAAEAAHAETEETMR